MVLDKRVEDGSDLLLGNGPDKAVHHLSALEEKEGGDVADTELHGNLVSIVDIALGDDYAAFIFGGDTVDGGGEHAAGAAP